MFLSWFVFIDFLMENCVGVSRNINSDHKSGASYRTLTKNMFVSVLACFELSEVLKVLLVCETCVDG